MGALDWVSGAGWFVMWAASLDFWSFERLHYFDVLLIGRMASERLVILVHAVGLDGDSDASMQPFSSCDGRAFDAGEGVFDFASECDHLFL